MWSILKHLWIVWKYSLGSFSDDKTNNYDNYIALLRTIIFISYLITNCFIIAGVIRHYDNEQIQCDIQERKEVGVLE
mgnify:CR=1 FL=1